MNQPARDALAAFRRTYGVEAELAFDAEGKPCLHVTSDPGNRPIPRWYGGLDVRVPDRIVFTATARTADGAFAEEST